MYEVARVQKLDANDLALFSESFVNHLFTLVERTRLLDDESLNYALIRLIVSPSTVFQCAVFAQSAASPSDRPERTVHGRHAGPICLSPTGRRYRPSIRQARQAAQGARREAHLGRTCEHRPSQGGEPSPRGAHATAEREQDVWRKHDLYAQPSG